jgi:hypothetical protein
LASTVSAAVPVLHYLTEEDEIDMREGEGKWFPVPLAYVIAWFNTPIS